MLEPWNPATLNLGTLTLEPWNFETSGLWKLLEPWTPGTLELLEPWNPWNPGTVKATWTFGHCFDKALKRSYFQTTLARLV